MDYSAWTFWINVALIVISGGQAVYIWITRRHEVTDKRVADIERELSLTQTRITSLESDVRHLPTHQDIQALLETMSDFGKEVGELTGKLSGLNRAVDLMNQHLLSRS